MPPHTTPPTDDENNDKNAPKEEAGTAASQGKKKRVRKKRPYTRKPVSLRGRYPHVQKTLLQKATPFGRCVLTEMLAQGVSLETLVRIARLNNNTFRRVLTGERRSSFSYQDLLRVARVLHVPAHHLFLLTFPPSVEDAASALFLVQAYMAVPAPAKAQLVGEVSRIASETTPLFPGERERGEQEQVRQLVLRPTREGEQAQTHAQEKGDTSPLASQRNTEERDEQDGQEHSFLVLTYKSPIDFRVFSNGWDTIPGLSALVHDTQYPESDREDVLDMLYYDERTPEGEWISTSNPQVVEDMRRYLERMKQEHR